MLLYCGFDHVREGKVHQWGKAMAGELRPLTGIDPFTIDQVVLSEPSHPGYECFDYHPELIQTSSILLTSKGHAKPNQMNGTDIRILYPRTTFTAGRPSWLLRGGLVGSSKFTGSLLSGEFSLPRECLFFE